MTRLALIAAALLFAAGALAGGNPDVVAYVDFDPPNRVQEYWPEPYESFSAYLCLGNLGEGVRCVSFAVNFGDWDYVGYTSLHNLLPGGSLECDTGGPPTGCTWCSVSCQPGPDICFARLDIFYESGSFCIEILDHAWYPRRVRDCSDPAGFDEYCVLAHGSVNGAVCAEGDCGTPVDDGTWGTIKSLYR
jgi:hypothetical protein